MANSKSAIKRIRQNEKRHLRNRYYIGRVRASIKEARQALASESIEEARASTMKAVSALDKAAVAGVLHRNNASRRKSRLMKQLAALEEETA